MCCFGHHLVGYVAFFGKRCPGRVDIDDKRMGFGPPVDKGGKSCEELGEHPVLHCLDAHDFLLRLCTDEGFRSAGALSAQNVLERCNERFFCSKNPPNPGVRGTKINISKNVSEPGKKEFGR